MGWDAAWEGDWVGSWLGNVSSTSKTGTGVLLSQPSVINAFGVLIHNSVLASLAAQPAKIAATGKVVHQQQAQTGSGFSGGGGHVITTEEVPVGVLEEFEPPVRNRRHDRWRERDEDRRRQWEDDTARVRAEEKRREVWWKEENFRRGEAVREEQRRAEREARIRDEELREYERRVRQAAALKQTPPLRPNPAGEIKRMLGDIAINAATSTVKRVAVAAGVHMVKTLFDGKKK